MLPGIAGIGGFMGSSVQAAPPAFQAVGSMADNGTSPSTANVPYPVGLQADDIAFLHVALINALDSDSIATPAGWTLISQDNINTAAYWHALFWKRLTGSESGTVSVGVTPGGIGPNDNLFGVMMLWRGCISSGTPYEALANNTGTSVNMTGSNVTTLGANRTILNVCASDTVGGSSLSAPAAGWTEQYDNVSTSGSADGGIKTYSIEKATAGTLSGVTHTLAGSDRWQVKSLALIPA